MEDFLYYLTPGLFIALPDGFLGLGFGWIASLDFNRNKESSPKLSMLLISLIFCTQLYLFQIDQYLLLISMGGYIDSSGTRAILDPLISIGMCDLISELCMLWL